MAKFCDRKPVDLTGRVFGALYVERRTAAPRGDATVHWLCQCRCGKKATVAGRNLTYGNTKSCGCKSHRPPRDLTGREFWDWQVLDEAARRGRRGYRRYWNCRCACGTEREVSHDALRSHRTKSCGCRPHKVTPQDGWF